MRPERNRACPNIIPPMPANMGKLALPNLHHIPQGAADLRRFLIWVPDPRGLRGRRHSMLPLLRAAAATVLAGALSLIAIGEWITDAPQNALDDLGFPPAPFTGIRTTPHPATPSAAFSNAWTATPWTPRQARISGPERYNQNILRLSRSCGRSRSTASPSAAPALRPRPRSNCWPRWTTTAWLWPIGRSLPRATRFPRSSPYWTPPT